MSLAAPERLSARAPEAVPGSVRLEVFGGQAVVAVAEASRLEAALSTVEQVVAAFDRACSRFREDSELSAVNASPGRSFKVSPLLVQAVQAALRAARLSGGAVDPTIGQALIALGYDRDFDEVPAAAARGPGAMALPRLTASPGWRMVQVDESAGTVSVPRGVRLDLGATGKALAADKAARAASSAAGCGVLVSLSGDLAIAGVPPAAGWRIRVTDDHRSEISAPGQWITLRSGGLATSSTSVRRWLTGDGEAHHLVDPATGRPAESPWRTVSVTAASCLDANIASTAAIIQGHSAIDWLGSLGLPSRLVSVQGTVRHVAGWPSEGEDLPLAALAP